MQGSKGGSKKQPTQRVPVEAANTLRSVAKGRILDLIQHGPIFGLADGLRSVSLDDTPLQNADGSFNFPGVSVTTRLGYPDQDVIPGFRAVENPRDVSAEVKYGTPIVRSVSNLDADAVVVTIRVNALTTQNPSTGDMNGNSVAISIQIRVNGGAWEQAVFDTIAGKTTSAYQRTYRVNLSSQGAWEVRVSRVSRDDPNSYSQSATFWTDMTEVVDARLNYPDCALVGIEIDARLFGNQMPSRSYDMKLSIIKVPSNYDPITRVYTGLWNGSFKMAWTDNPAWCYYDLATHPVIGAGLSGVDKWALYQIGRYCDELVPDGFGGTEPRFTLNTIFSERTEAITTLTTLASVFRGMTYWGTNTVVPVGDMPRDPCKLVGPANVVNGEFEYSGTSLKERHSVAVVMWNDPSDNGKAKPELVEDAESVDLFGWREVQVTAFGCTSRGQANRLGRWILYSEREETETVKYTAVSDQADLRPGDVIELSDPDRAGARLSGRIVSPGTLDLTLDKVPPQVSGSSWYLSVIMPDGVTARRPVAQFSGNVVRLGTALPSAPLAGAMWILYSQSVVPKQYRVSSISEQPDGVSYEVIATEYDPKKYQRVEQELKLPDTPVSLIPTGAIQPISGLSAKVHTYLAGGTTHQGLAISWSASPDIRVTDYVVEVQSPVDVRWRTAHHGPGLAFDEKDAPAGAWLIRARAVSDFGVGSLWVSLSVNVAGLLMPVPPDTVEVSAGTFSVALNPRGAYAGATYEFWRSYAALAVGEIEANATLLSVSTNLVDVNLTPRTQYFYYVRGVNAYGVSSWHPVQATTTADFSDILTAVDTDIKKPGGLYESMAGTQAGVTEALQKIQAVTGKVTQVQDGVTQLEWETELESVRHLGVVAMHKGATALVTVEQQTRTDSDEALSTQLTTVQAAFNTSLSQVQQKLTALADADSATASSIQDLSATQASNHASVSQQITAQASYTDGAVARALTTVTVNGKKAIFGISSDGTVAEIGAVADRFYVYNPMGGTYTLAFAVVNGQTVIQDALIRDASITTVKIGDASITGAKIADATITTAKIGDASITGAKIADATITTAKIGDAAVDTLKIAKNSVMVPASATGTSSASTVVTVTQDSSEQPVVIFVSTVSNAVGAAGYSVWTIKRYVRVYRNGTLLKTYIDSTSFNEPAHDMATALTVMDHPGVGTHTYTVQVRNYNDSAPAGTSTTIVCMLAKR